MSETRRGVREQWEAILSGRDSQIDAALWAQERLTQGDWDDEVTFRGLMRLSDMAHGTTAMAKDEIFRTLWDWMEQLHTLDDDPITWNRFYALRFVSRLSGDDFRMRAARMFVDNGMLVEGDLVEFRFNN
ncbi:hypothetical protein ACEXQD_10140 [Herbiconiux sp. P15]|uniref:hypothetical protein n=1 Tax=Herbiconiux liukaitaii TaxID=3342799 RepID=UPI0035BABA84